MKGFRQKRENQKGATLIEAALSLSILFSILFGTLSLSTSLHQQQKITEALHRAAIKISRISSVNSQSNAPDRIDARCSVFGSLIQEELNRSAIQSARIVITPPNNSERGTLSTTQQEIIVRLAERPLFGRPTARVQISTPHFVSPVDCSGNGTIYTGNED